MLGPRAVLTPLARDRARASRRARSRRSADADRDGDRERLGHAPPGRLPNGAFLEVEAEGTGQRLIAFDVLGSGVGERVLVTQGSVAAAWFPASRRPSTR